MTEAATEATPRRHNDNVRRCDVVLPIRFQMIKIEATIWSPTSI